MVIQTKKLKITEACAQIAFISYLEIYYPDIFVFHIPNGEKRHPKIGAKLKKMGVRAGVADLYIMDYKLFIEMKKPYKKIKNLKENAYLTENQIQFKKKALKTNHAYIIAYGFKDAVEKFENYRKSVLKNLNQKVKIK